MGPRSCYAIKEGFYVKGDGVNYNTGLAILTLIHRDYRRGWTYDHECRRIPMSVELAYKRLRYLIPLCKKHYNGKGGCKNLEKLVNTYPIPYKLPRSLVEKAYKYMVALENAPPAIKKKIPLRVKQLVKVH